MIDLPISLVEIKEKTTPMPRKEDVEDLVRRCNSYPKDEMVLVKDWSGEAFKVLFDGIIKELAEKEGVDQWDYFACFLHSLFE